jgi:hypothetical protein
MVFYMEVKAIYELYYKHIRDWITFCRIGNRIKAKKRPDEQRAERSRSVLS